MRFLTSILAMAVCAATTHAQISSRITETVDESRLTVLRGNTYPLARAEFDRGPAPGDLPMHRMLLVLRRSAEQERELTALLEQQQDKALSQYHAWLTPEQFGQRFGPSDQDLKTVTGWLESHGLQVTRVSKGRTVIEFSGTAAQVQEARWRLPPLRPKRSAYGGAGVRSGSGQRDSNHALMTQPSPSESAQNLFHLTYKDIF